ncbi:MAG: hypothetical protein HC916_12395 [Coleofasciculaceae cyanobacterium SM2_1_6]|nr:hypothetical protein [Coleofasciculaceae cyanobacterium SM2_1_6]
MSSKAIATLVQIIESLPENMQIQVVEHLKEYIQQSNITLPNSNGSLETPAEVTNPQAKTGFDWEEFRRRRDSLPPDTNQVAERASFDWDEWERRVEAAKPDPDELTMEEICEIVREVRRENLTQKLEP